MSVEYSLHGAGTRPSTLFRSPDPSTVASYEQELRRHRRAESGLREALAREETLLCQKDELIQHQAVLSQESDHRLLNGVQMIVSLLSLQARASENAEVAAQLAAAADRIATIGRIHQRLHHLDGVQTVAFNDVASASNLAPPLARAGMLAPAEVVAAPGVSQPSDGREGTVGQVGAGAEAG